MTDRERIELLEKAYLQTDTRLKAVAETIRKLVVLHKNRDEVLKVLCRALGIEWQEQELPPSVD
jgi:hypothetical protein